MTKTNECIFRVLGPPQGKARPRVTRHGTYTPKRTRDYERAIRQAWQDAGAVSFGTAPVSVTLYAEFEPPKSLSKKKRLDLIDRGAPTKKPDADNILKAVCDALNGHAYADDAQIVRAVIVKEYGLCAGVYVTIRTIGEEEEP